MLLNLSAILITTALVVVSLLLILLVVMQRPRQEGLAPAFGNSITDHCWGPQTATVLHRITVWLGVLLFTLCLALSIVKSVQARALTGLSLPDSTPPAAERALPN